MMAVCLVLVMGMAMVFANGAGETSGTTTIRVLNYIDMSEPNSANEISMVWDKFAQEHPEITVIREDLFN